MKARFCTVRCNTRRRFLLCFPFQFLARSVMLLLWFLVFVFGYLKFENIKNLNKHNKKNPLDNISIVQSFSCF